MFAWRIPSRPPELKKIRPGRAQPTAQKGGKIMKIEALVVGATGIVGRGVSEILLDHGAVVHGVSRHAHGLIPGVQHVAVDLLKGAAAETLSRLRPTHVYLAT